MYHHILIVIDLLADCRGAVDEGVELAQAHGAALTLFAVLPPLIETVVDMPTAGLAGADDVGLEAVRLAERHLAAARCAAESAGLQAETVLATCAGRARCVVDAARQRDCDLIVISSAGQNAVMRLLGGSLIPGLITLSPVPVLVVRTPEAAPGVRAAHAMSGEAQDGRRT